MTKRRFSLWDLVFVALLVVAALAAAFHFAQGRYANALIALGAFVVGLVLLVIGVLRGTEPSPLPVPRPPKRPRPPRPDPPRRPDGRLQDWMPAGIISGLVATSLMTCTLLLAYGFAAAFSTRGGGGLAAQWVGALVHNPLTATARTNLALAVVVHFVAGILWALVYAAVVEPRLHGPGWRRGLLFAALPWAFSLLVFLPLAGAGILGLGLGAGPLPIIGNVVLHVVYGLTLGAVYVSEGLLTEDGQATDAAEPTAMRHAERAMAMAVLPGLLLGAVIGYLSSGLVAPGAAPDTVAVLGAIIGCVVAILLGSYVGVTPDVPGR
ncbi:MAG TPA: DUF6789 family protein [Thermomicrobiaceae bacterium]|nr:DUF6789 family protein [Thermomicrobiaceae bacterium]